MEQQNIFSSGNMLIKSEKRAALIASPPPPISKLVDGSVKSEHPCVTFNLKGKTFSLSPLGLL